MWNTAVRLVSFYVLVTFNAPVPTAKTMRGKAGRIWNWEVCVLHGKPASRLTQRGACVTLARVPGGPGLFPR